MDSFCPTLPGKVGSMKMKKPGMEGTMRNRRREGGLRMLPTVCQCCGERMGSCGRGINPNLCVDCERITEDDSPARLVQTLECDWEDVTWEERGLVRVAIRAA